MQKYLFLMAVTLLLITGSASAAIFNLADLVEDNQQFTSDDGQLLFSNFQVTISGDLSADLNDYQIVTRTQGFRIIGDFNESVLSQMVFSYDVETVNNHIITLAGMGISSTLLPTGSTLTIHEFFVEKDDHTTALLDDESEEADLFVGWTGSNYRFSDFEEFGDPRMAMHVVKNITISPDGIDQDFDTDIPEPASVGLMGIGLLLMTSRTRQAKS